MKINEGQNGRTPKRYRPSGENGRATEQIQMLTAMKTLWIRLKKI